jgi:hypothetical protein
MKDRSPLVRGLSVCSSETLTPLLAKIILSGAHLPGHYLSHLIQFCCFLRERNAS